MATFEVLQKCCLKKTDVSQIVIVEIIKKSLCKHYAGRHINPTSDGLIVQGDLQAFGARAITAAEVKFRIEDGELTYRVVGSVSFGKWPWAWLALFFVVNVIWGYESLFILGLFSADAISYFLSRDKPKQYFENAFKAIQFEIG
ncbi:hypothetical protein [Dyella acidiphila]|uniref:Uncharacterized protein n=1 Tax=Dyella acidiphila TaxID=2775866 RepID=A0ABR9GFG7_9GAMM|nr:hypothetical protein [Dyella acidiphila]MBE1162796.1 hypothetical protein [Dyella acidiphila]